MKKRTTTAAKKIEINFSPSKIMKKEPKLETLAEPKLVERIIKMKKKIQKYEIAVLKAKIMEMEQTISDL